MSNPLQNFLLDYAVFETDSSGTIVSWSPGASRIFGYSQDEIQGRNSSCFYLGKDVSLGLPEKHLSDATDGATEHKGWLVRNDGIFFLARVLISPLSEIESSRDGFLFLVQDLSDLKLTEAQRLSTIAIELSNDAMISTDVEGQIQSWNSGAERIYGHSASEIVGSSIFMLFPDGLPGLTEQFLKEPSSTECSQVKKDGKVFDALVKVYPLKDIKGKNFEHLWICKDISLSKKLITELERSNTDLQQFAYVASHDLQEPLRAVQGCLQLLESSMAGKLDERSSRFMSEAMSGATRMQNLVNDLLNYARINTTTREMKEVHLETLLTQAQGQLGKQIEETNAEIESDPLPTLPVDPNQIRQVFQNLISNAIKYCEGKPRILVSANQTNGTWTFCISDNGIGFDEQFSERIFEIFQRLHTRSEYSGTGIGLAICRRIIQRHEGRMWAESNGDSGSQFYFTLPATRGN